MMRFLVITALLILPTSHALTPATPIQLNEWLRAVKLDHPQLVQLTTPEIMLALAEARRVDELAVAFEKPVSKRDALGKRQKFRSAIGKALRQMEKDGHLKETAAIDELVFSKARNLGWIHDEPYHAARRLALNGRRQALLELGETMLLTPWRDHRHSDPARKETGSTIRNLGSESQRLIDLLHEQNLLGELRALAAKGFERRPGDFKTVQVWIFCQLRLNGDSPELWEAFEKTMPDQNTWRRDPLVSFAYFCLQRGIPAPILHQQAAGIVSSAPHAYNRLDGRHSAELDLLAAASAILSSDFKEAGKRHESAHGAFIGLDARKQERFIKDHHRLLIESLADPALQGSARTWFNMFADNDMPAGLSYRNVIDLWEWALHRDSPDSVLRHCRQLAETLREKVSSNPEAFAGGSEFSSELRRHFALLLDEGMIEEATELYRDLEESSINQPQGRLPLKAIGKWIKASTEPRQVILWRNAKDQLSGTAHWLQTEEGPQTDALQALLFPCPGNDGNKEGEVWHMHPAKLLKKEVSVQRRDGLYTTPIPEERESAYMGLRMANGPAPAELQVVPTGPNLIPSKWMTAHRGLPAMNASIFRLVAGNPGFVSPLNIRKDLNLELISPIIAIETAVNYSLTGVLRKAGSQATADISVEFLDQHGGPIRKVHVARPSIYHTGRRTFFQLLLVRDHTPGPALQMPVGTRSLRLSLSHSGTVAANYEDLILSQFSLSNPDEIPRERSPVDPLASTHLEFDHPVEAIATNPSHNQLVVALGDEGQIHVYAQGENTSRESHSLPKGVAVPWLASAENGTIASLTQRPQASHPVFYVFAEGKDPVVVATEHPPQLPTLDRKGRWLLWMDVENDRRFINYHDLRRPEAETIRRHLDIAEELEVMFVSSIWTNDSFALQGSDFRIDFELPDCRQKRFFDQQKPLDHRDFGGFYRTQFSTFLFSRCQLHPFPNYIFHSQGMMTLNSPSDATIKTLNLNDGQLERSADLNSPLALALPVAMRKGFLEKDLLFTLEADPTKILRFDREALRKIPLTF